MKRLSVACSGVRVLVVDEGLVRSRASEAVTPGGRVTAPGTLKALAK